MKSSVTIALTSAQLKEILDSDVVFGPHVTLSRVQVELIYATINEPEPLKPGDKVYHVNLDVNKFTFIILDMTGSTSEESVVASFTDGKVFHYLTRNLRRIE